MADSNNKGILLVGGLAAAIGVAYLYFKNACDAGTGPSSICSMSLFKPSAPAAAGSTPGAGATLASCQAGGGTWNATTLVCTPPASAPPPPPAADPWANAIALMKANAGSNSQDLDHWAWQFQYQPRPSSPATPTGYGNASYITPTLMTNIIALAGGDRTKPVSADTFIGYLRQVLSAAGLSGYEMPAWMFHRGGRS